MGRMAISAPGRDDKIAGSFSGTRGWARELKMNKIWRMKTPGKFEEAGESKLEEGKEEAEAPVKGRGNAT